jgi:hypothetical protein
MPFFRVLLEGNGLCIESSDEAPSIAGFFTTKVVWAKAPESAGLIAIEVVSREWSAQPYASQPGAKSLSLVAADCHQLGFVRGLLERPSGFTFFAAEA